jgi:hypothetical protein
MKRQVVFGCNEELEGTDGRVTGKPALAQLADGKGAPKRKLRIYVASSWRNEFQPGVVAQLRRDGHEVYDFKDSGGFHWSEVDPAWQTWPAAIPKYLDGLLHPCANRGFSRDMTHLMLCDVCVYVMPCGVSASLELGWACGAGKPTVVYVPGLREPDLMVKMAGVVTDNMDSVRAYVRGVALSTTGPQAAQEFALPQTGAEAEAAGRAAYEADAAGDRPCRGCGVVNGPHDTNCRVAYSLAARYEAEHRRVHGHTSWCDAFNDGQRECNCSTGPQAGQGVTEPKVGKA